jgi:hypothetical protein
MEKMSVYLPVDLKLSIRVTAKRRGQSEAHVMREMQAVYVANEPPTLPSVFGRVDDGTLSASNYEDWLEHPSLDTTYGCEDGK